MRGPLPIVALLYGGGIILGMYYPLPLALLFSLSFGFLSVALVSPRYRMAALCLTLPLFGWTSLVSETAILSPHDLRLLFGEHAEYVTVRGLLTEAPVYRERPGNHRISGHSTVTLEVDHVRRNGAWEVAFGRLAMSTPGLLDERYFAGRPVEVTGVVQVPKGPSAPGQFDYPAYLGYQGIYHLLRSEGTNDWHPCQLSPGRGELRPPLCDRFSSWAERTLARGLIEDESLRLLWAMVVGWKTALTQEVAEPFMQSGTLHIFAISGLHIALISAILVQVLRVVRVPRAACGLIVIPLIWFYTLATGWQASAIRSTVMMTVIILGWSLQRPSDLVNSLAAAGLIILIWDPRQLFQAGFQLSFFVVLGLALIVPQLETARQKLLKPDPLVVPELRPKWRGWVDRGVRLVTTSLATSLAAWLGSVPLIAYYFYMITPGSLLANLVIVPLSSIALMSSLGSLFCGGWLPYFSELFNHSSWLWMELMIRLSKWFASLPGAYWYVRPPTALEFGIYYALLAGLLSGSFLLPRRRVWAMFALASALSVWIIDWNSRRGDFQLTVLPVLGAAFVDAPGVAEDLLVNCGDASVAESMVKPFLRSQGVNRLPALLLTHGDVHQVGGLDTIAARFPIGHVLTSRERSRSPAYRAILAKLERSPERWRQVQYQDQIGRWRVLHPASGDNLPQAMNNAVVLRAEIYGTRILMLSTLGRTGQRKLIERGGDLTADVLIGGIPSQTEAFSEALLQVVRPKVLVVAAADYPASARPGAALRIRLKEKNIPVIHTSDSGAAILTISRRGWEIRTMDGRFVSSQTKSSDRATSLESNPAAFLPGEAESEQLDK